ncbi:phosphatase PAP2 family protein [Paenibacillus albidus]|uniref:phosphatase PAP2 family protein n=1 Tax=Paenibacillus albidus TaxID=2041023 RepID=UPI001BE62BCB|nr:phosphatase PAP2 family protein [Paenibacillus albidus]MBT2289369.1 phosphatase PAP2 family protein [Paenibacillus albidus]
MSRSFQTYLPLLWILVIPVLNIFYGILNGNHGQVSSLMTDLDAAIPFVPGFIIPYLIWYPFIIFMLVVFCIKDKSVYYRILFTQCISLIVCYMIYYLFQTTVPRPLIPGEGVLYRLVNFVYSTDNPYNCFPSIHVLTSYLMIKGAAVCPGLYARARLVVNLCAWSIICSTLFVKQHVLLDAAGAIALVEILWYLMFRLPSRHSLLYKGEEIREEH